MNPLRLELLRDILLGRDCLGDEAYQLHVRYCIVKGWLTQAGAVTERGLEMRESLGVDDDEFDRALARTRQAFGARWVDVNQFLWSRRTHNV